MVLYENDDPDWFLVKSREGQIGLAPSNYIETLEPEQPVCEPRWAIVLYDFDAQGEEELTVKEQEQVLIVDYVSSNEWWTVEHQDGRIGIVPTTYVKFQEDYEADLAKEENESRRQQELEQLLQQQKQQQEQLEKERARQAEAERRRKMQEEAKQRELDAKRAAARAAAAANSPQITAASSPRRSQIPAPLPPTANTHDTGKPDPSKVRTWTDRTGAFKVEAQFLACNNGKIRLHKINGVKIDVPVQKMCTEDLHYIEQETGARLLEDKSDNIPLAHLTSNKTDNDNGFNWFDYFTKINIPSKSALRYAATFQQDGLGEKDIDNLTHRKMKLLGMTEKHVQRLQRYLETQVAEPPSDDEQGGINVSKKGKKTVTFGSTSFIQDDDDDVDETDPEIQRQRQIEEDERFARQLQLQENDTTRTHLHRRGTGRPTPSTSAPKDMNAQIMDKIKNQLRTEPLIPSPVSPSTQNTSAATVSVPITTSSTGFQDDAWANRPSAPTTTNTTQSIQYTPQQNQPTVPLPPRQRPTPQLSQTNQVDPNLLSQWTSNNPTPSPQQQRPVPQPIQQQQSFTQIQPTTNVVHVQPALPHRSPGTFNQQQQQSQQFNPQPLYGQNQPQQQQQQPFLSSNVQPQMAMNVPVSSVLPPPLVPTSSPMSTLKPQPTGRNWTSSKIAKRNRYMFFFF
ncbi:uncharacterized protein BX664DRAFT_371963 [Halteromyces radiatus]|uniref:uncharacterized protein n=1 Tax=Halteromyces radiatus TaxID=101107 RepID=UPI002220009B|nr:uncharacterized protein BX664DRAFT_371963 [Halteromyces radiatus]KAI8093166.1 hypothetical protein BX664DRAFT_371963 [Halteromyces radiatus]